MNDLPTMRVGITGAASRDRLTPSGDLATWRPSGWPTVADRMLYCSMRAAPIADEACPDCGFDAMIRAELTWLFSTGVRTDTREWCGRCRAEGDRG